MNITKKLVLQNIEANNWKHDDRDREITICWALHFEFFGVAGFSVFVTDDAILRENPSFQLVESDEPELHDSFMHLRQPPQAVARRQNWIGVKDPTPSGVRIPGGRNCSPAGIAINPKGVLTVPGPGFFDETFEVEM